MTRKVNSHNIDVVIEKVNIETAPQILNDSTLKLLQITKKIADLKSIVHAGDPNEKYIKDLKIIIENLELKIRETFFIAVDSAQELEFLEKLKNDNSTDLTGENINPMNTSDEMTE